MRSNILVQIYEMYVRSHLDYLNFIYHIPELVKKKTVAEEDEVDEEDDSEIADTNTRPTRMTFRMKELESVRYHTASAVAGTWKGTSRS